MKRRTIPAAILLGWAIPALAGAPTPLNSIRAIHELTNEQAGTAIPVEFEGTVTYHVSGDLDLFVQDGNVALYVEAPRDLSVTTGDRVRVEGKTRASYRPDVVASQVTFLGHGPAPDAVPAGYSQLIRSELDCRRVTIHAQVRSANVVTYGKFSSIYLELLVDGGYIDATINASNEGILRQLLDAQIEITGVVSGKFDSKSQLTGIVLEVPSLLDLHILRRAAASLESLPVTPMDDILKGYSVNDRTQRVRVHGAITYYEPGSAVVLQDGGKSLWISTLTEKPMRVGDLADATGFPDAREGSLTLTHAEIEDRGVAAPIQPQLVKWAEMATGTHAFELISTEGRVLMSVREADRDEYVLMADHHLFSSVFHHPDAESGVTLPEMKQIPVDSTVRVTGVSMVHYGSDPFVGPVASELLLRSPDDIAVVAGPSWLSVPNLIFTAIFLLLVAGTAGMRGWILERKVRRQTAALACRIEVEAALERRRSRILEDINGSRPLPEILNEIADVTSLALHGAPCWHVLIDGEQFGAKPANVESRRIVSEEIPSRCGAPLGAIFAAVPLDRQPDAEESESIRMGARLASLGIETRKLYSDLVRRSEFDLLTDVHNRFSLDRQMEACLALAREQTWSFGLIYVDLDEFKQVNDQYGHRVGDLYLQEVAVRMKRQLRGGDMLARLGGDEFAALMPMVGSRAHVEEIAARLERSFDEPFEVEGYCLHGSASVGIALYPEDGTTKDSLLSAADAAMYVTKHMRNHADEVSAKSDGGFAPES